MIKPAFKAAMVIGLLAAFVGGGTYWWVARNLSDQPPLSPLERMVDQFDLTAEQASRIETLHREYRAVCDDHCQKIVAARSALLELRHADADAAVLAEAENALRIIDQQCRDDLRAHVREVAAAMPAPAGQRYLDQVLPAIKGFDHSGAPDLLMGRHGEHEHH